MKISVLGTGYVGLVAGACFSDSGNQVTCVDVNPEVIQKLNRGEIPIFEPGLEEIVERNLAAGRIRFTQDVAVAVQDSEVIFIAVGTPQDEDGSADLQYVLKAAEMIRANLAGNATVVIKSTVPVGTAAKVKAVFHGAAYQVNVVSNPEFLKEGTAVGDFLRPERVVIGTDCESARQIMEGLYSPYLRSGSPLLVMSNASAELAKYAANAFLATKVSFINSLALLSEKVHADIHDVRKALISDSRIGSKFLYPGCGYGGSCFPKDVKALIHLAKEQGMDLSIVEAVDQANDRQKRVLFEKMVTHFGESLSGRTVAVWGLAFKPMTDDVREAPSLALIRALLEAGCQVRAFDPVAMATARRVLENQVQFGENAYDILDEADAVAVVTEWNEFRTPDFAQMKKRMRTPVIFDGRNIFDPRAVLKEGLTYYGIGKAATA